MHNTCERIVVDDNRPVLQVVKETVCHRIADERPERIVAEASNAERLVVSEGPQGVPGAAGSGFTFHQPTAALVWTINHNLGFWPDVATYRLGGTEMKGAVHNLSLNTLTVTFKTAVAGYARL